MKASEVRQKYFKFFEERGHKQIVSSPIVPENDPTTLFTSSGMQQLVPYLMGEKHPLGKRLIDSQRLLRAHGIHSDDTEEVGDNRHQTFFEMLGNWSLGDYFKKDQLTWVFEFLTSKEEGLGLSPKNIFVTVFEGNDFVPKDEESIAIWKDIYSKHGIDAKEGERIVSYPAKKNWWSRSGPPEDMPIGEIGGPDSELFYDFGEDLGLHEKSLWKDEKCHPNCDCGRFLEIGNSVFIQYKKVSEGTFEELPQRNVDFGGGLERLTAATIHSHDTYKTDIFWPTICTIENLTKKKYGQDQKIDGTMRIIADHLRASCFLISEGIEPSNKQQGYVLRRLIRRAVFRLRDLDFDITQGAISTFAKAYKDDYEEISEKWPIIKDMLNIEAVKFARTLDKGLKEAGRIKSIDAKKAFDLYQTYGFPLELTIELFRDKGQEVDKEQFKKEFGIHQQKSRSAAAGTFKGGLADHSDETTQLHTATHLIHAALRKILGEHVQQKGSNITAERLRFDFTHAEKITPEQIKEIEELVNNQIAKGLIVQKEVMPKQKALAEGALAFFPERYPDITNVYTILDPESEKGYFSKELCGGPHVESLSQFPGRVNIYKEESVSAGTRRIYARILLDTNN